MIDLTQIIVALIGLLSAVLTAFLVPLIRSKIEESKMHLSEQEQQVLMELAKAAVKAAEQIYTESGKGKEKKAYVQEYLAENGYILDEKAVDIAIESAVLELKQQIGV
jgi:LL-H family phage holin